MQLVDTRRLTGPNLLATRPLVVVELRLEGEAPEQVLGLYREELTRMREALGLGLLPPFEVRLRGPALMVGYDAPLDLLFACAECSEWAALSVIERLGGREPLPLEPKLEEVRTLANEAANPKLLALQAEARQRSLPFLWDDDAVSLGHGKWSRTYALSSLPEVEEVPWESLRAVPVALVTGTNGKTTSSRLLAHLLRAGGWAVGASSSDALTVHGQVFDTGDCTGPFAARKVLRHAEVEAAVLETARGGILRRGLAVEACDVALVTNVGEDHLGSFGVEDVPSMAEVKGVIARAVHPRGTVVLNAADPHLRGLASTLQAAVRFFADLETADAATHEAVRAHVTAGGSAVVALDGQAVLLEPGSSRALLELAEVPVTFGGAARYNVENVLGALASALALGLGAETCGPALRDFGAAQNPGRGQVLEVQGVTVVLDFAHNPDGIRAVLGLVSNLRARRPTPARLAVLAASAGDRTDAEIEGMVRSIVGSKPDRIFLRELEGYLRGRAPGETPALLRRFLVEQGHPAETCLPSSSEVDGLEQALDWARPGDVVLLLVHLDRDPVQTLLEQRSRRPEAQEEPG